MNRITPEHLSRSAIAYVRQSTPGQVRDHVESQRWQYDLVSRARQLGWQDCGVIDEDLGRTGNGTVERPGFERLIASVCRKEVGVILAVDASRLARNGREWHALIEFCGLVGCLLADEQSVYDPGLATDRMLLGVQGAVSEFEASNFRRRAEEGLRRKAERAELVCSVATGYRKVGNGIEKDPDLRVREAISLVFRKFAEMQSVRQVYLWLRQEGLELPGLKPGQETATWRRARYGRVYNILTNPVYAGAYVFGRRQSRTEIRDGRKYVSRRDCTRPDEWRVLKRDNHEAYITWETFERNRILISNNALGAHRSETRGPVRSGNALLSGLLRCGHCGHRMSVAYSGQSGRVIRYECRGMSGPGGRSAEKCISFGGLRVDEAIGRELARVLQPIGVEAALRAVEDSRHAESEAIRQQELALGRAQYEASRAERQYDAMDPENRQVAAELERRWNERLEEVRRIEAILSGLHREERSCPMSEDERIACLSLGANLQRAWSCANGNPAVQKRILRAALTEVLAKVEGNRIDLLLHWQGGDHTELSVRRNASGKHRFASSLETEKLVAGLARTMPDASIAALLNRLGRKTAKGNSWVAVGVRSFRSCRKIPVFREGEMRERNECTAQEAAKRLGINAAAVRWLITTKRLPARQLCEGAPWTISLDDLALLEARKLPEQRRYPTLEGFEETALPQNSKRNPKSPQQQTRSEV